MPQIWMTYDEIGAMLNCSPAEARGHAVERRLDRKVSRDGKTRAKLCMELIGVFFDQVRASEHPRDVALDGLWRVHSIMSRIPSGPTIKDSPRLDLPGEEQLRNQILTRL